VNHLRRELAPVTDAAWEQIDNEARRSLRHFLSARKLIDMSGPLGWDHSAANLGHVTALDGPATGTTAALRVVRPYVELRTPFTLPIAELDAAERGADDLELDAVIDAARRAALVEDTAAFHGYGAAGITGITAASPHAPIMLTGDYDGYPRVVAMAVAVLRGAGVDGPYAAALGSRSYTGVIETTERGGYPIFDHLRLILGGPVVWAPAVDGIIVISQRGGDYELVVGEDFSIGFASATADEVSLYLEETLTLKVKSPEAGVALVHPSDGPGERRPARSRKS
jgi:uncharacterized linocin/CFP29 family protein